MCYSATGFGSEAFFDTREYHIPDCDVIKRREWKSRTREDNIQFDEKKEGKAF